MRIYTLRYDETLGQFKNAFFDRKMPNDKVGDFKFVKVWNREYVRVCALNIYTAKEIAEQALIERKLQAESEEQK